MQASCKAHPLRAPQTNAFSMADVGTGSLPRMGENFAALMMRCTWTMVYGGGGEGGMLEVPETQQQL